LSLNDGLFEGEGRNNAAKEDNQETTYESYIESRPGGYARKSQLSLDFEAKPKEAASPKRLVKRLQTLPKS
jgi:hypothetical protein